jgi:hypothetical protein
VHYEQPYDVLINVQALTKRREKSTKTEEATDDREGEFKE